MGRIKDKITGVPEPKTKGIALTPVVMQMEAVECGAACLTMILAYYRKWIPLETVREDCGISRDGANAETIMQTAGRYGLETKGYRMKTETLRARGSFPCVIFWNENHFVVLNGFRGRRAVLTDPARGLVTENEEQFEKSFSGVVLTFRPGEAFEPGGKRKNMLKYARSRMWEDRAAVIFVLMTTLISALFGVINPAMTRVFLDRLLTGYDLPWLTPFLWIMTGLCVLQVAAMWINAVYSLKVDGKIAAVSNTAYVWQVLRLPVQFFSLRSAGDILARKDANAEISQTLVKTVAPLMMHTAMMVLYLVIMLRYSPLLTAIGLGALLLQVAVERTTAEKRVNLARVRQRDAANLASATLAGIGMAETIKAAGAERDYFRKWAGYQAAVNTQSVKYEKMNTLLGILPGLITTLAGDLVLLAGVRLIMQGSFTLGLVYAFQGVLTAFMTPAQTLITSGRTIQESRVDVERVEDVMNHPTDPCLGGTDAPGTEAAEAGSLQKLRGEIELRGVTFGYANLEEPLIKDLSLKIGQGSKVAFVGKSGCGKSTLIKLISGLYQPWSGEILYDGVPMNRIPRRVVTGSVATVDQEIVLFEDSITENIRMWDESIEEYEVTMAARDAGVHETIARMPGGYQRRLSENGWDLSGGQRQQMEIARALAQDPTVLLLDEATSALDALSEYDVIRAIRDRGITTVMVAHRLSTIRDADVIVVLDRGSIREMGTHEELLERGGLYAQLVRSE